MALCPTCQDFDIQKFSTSPQKTRSYELLLVAIAASDGCPFCSFIYNNKPAHIGRDINNLWIHMQMKTSSEIGYDALPPGPGLQFTQLHIWIGVERAPRGRYHKEFRLVSDPGSVAELSGDIPRAYIGNRSDSEYHFNVLRQWLVGCQSRSHSACNKTIPGDIWIDDNYDVPLPSRLISVGYPGDEFVYLRETRGEKGAYITLSYVRGSPQRIPATTSANIVERQNGILVERLPKTFQDVITITRKLNIPYVWIDALCIVQDDEEDWKRETSQMARIYQFSLLTVAATGAEDASKGCFLQRAPTSVEIGPLAKLPYRTREGVVSGQFSIYEQHTTFAEDYDRFVEKSPLLKRGWVFQERVLSRRMVHYTKGKMFFECRTSRFMDECQEGVDKRQTKLGFWGLELKGKGEGFSMEELKPFESAILSKWYMAISIYSKLRLTKSGDKLAAIAGVAKEFQMLLSMERDKPGKPSRDGSTIHTPFYVSGLWSHDLLYGLSWYSPKPQSLQIAENKAPSWSWASWHTPIEWPGCTSFRPECKVVIPGSLGLLVQFRRPVEPKIRISKATDLSSFAADLPARHNWDATMTFQPELQITGKIREVWRRPETSHYLTSKERDEFSAICELNGDEKQWLTRCHGVYNDEAASKPSGFCCFEDYWLTKSTESTKLGDIGADLNGGIDEDEAVALLLSLKDEDLRKDRPGTRNLADDDLELAIAASLGESSPTRAKVLAKKVDLDGEFKDQLAIALKISAEEGLRNRKSSVGSESGEGSGWRETSGKGVEANEGTEKQSKTQSAEITGGSIKDLPTSAKDHDTEGGGEEAQNSQSTRTTRDPAQIMAERRAREALRGELLTEQVTKLTHTSGKEAAILGDSTMNEAPNPAGEVTNQTPEVPPRISSAADVKGKQKPVPDPSTSSQGQSSHLSAKLHCLPLYSTRASGGLSYLGLSPTIHTVLFLRASGERDDKRVFERIGVGKIVERGFFGNVKTETVFLA